MRCASLGRVAPVVLVTVPTGRDANMGWQRQYARQAWAGAALAHRFRGRVIRGPGLSWPLVVGRDMSRSAEVALACTSYAITAPWRIPGASIVWDFAAFDRSLRAPRRSLLERV